MNSLSTLAKIVFHSTRSKARMMWKLFLNLSRNCITYI